MARGRLQPRFSTTFTATWKGIGASTWRAARALEVPRGREEGLVAHDLPGLGRRLEERPQSPLLPLETPGNDTQDLELVGNTITDTVGDAIAFRDVATVDIHHNTITNCSSVGIMPITNYQGVRVHDNTVANCNISFRFLNMDEEVHQPKQI